MKAALITTIKQNVGDDLVREGILFLFEKAGFPLEPLLIHKHLPATTRPLFANLHRSMFARVQRPGFRHVLSRITTRADAWLPMDPSTDSILAADIIIQCGTPVYWCFATGEGCHRNEWYQPLLQRRYRSIRHRVPFVNLGAGSCQPYESDGSEFASNGACEQYVRELTSLSAVTTVRDRLAQDILARMGFDVPLLPCPSVFARERHQSSVSDHDGYVAMNFMPKGGHYLLGQGIDAERWKSVFSSFVRRLSNHYPVAMACHDRAELDAASVLFPEITRRYLGTVPEGLDFYSRASAYIGSRVHGAMACASFGNPSIVVGSDSRSAMAEEIGCERIFVANAEPDGLVSAFEKLWNTRDRFARNSRKLIGEALEKYMSVLVPLRTAMWEGR